MAIHQDGAMCDGCGEFEAYAGLHFWQIIKRIKANGWRIVKSGGGFKHYCPQCTAELAERD